MEKKLWPLWFGSLIASSSYTMLLPFLPFYLKNLGVEESMISLWSGMVFSASFFVSAIMSPLWGRWADRSGKRRMLLRAGFSLAIVYFLGGFVTTPFQLFIVRILQGFATGYAPAALAIVTSSVSEDKVGFHVGMMQNAILIGTIIGPLFGGLLSDTFGIPWSFRIAGIIMLLSTLAVMIFVKEPKQTIPTEQSSIFSDLKVAYSNKTLMQMLILLVIAQIGIIGIQPLITLYIGELQGSLDGASLTSGMVFGLIGIAGATSAPFWGKIGQKSGYIKILVVTLIGAGLFDSLVFFSKNIYSFSFIEFIYGFFVAGIGLAVNTVAVMSTERNFRGRVFGLTMSATQLGSMLGPIISGIIAVWIDYKFVFLYMGIFIIVIGLLVWKKNIHTSIHNTKKELG